MTNAYNGILQATGEYNRKNRGGIEVKTDEPLANHTSFRIGGPADLFFLPSGEQELCFLMRLLKEHSVRSMVVGRGSNLLFDDAGYRGAVVSTDAMRSVSAERNLLCADAGASLISCAKAALDHSLTGMEFAHGIPGSCGGAVYMNAGAYDGVISQILQKSRYYDTDTDSIGAYTGAEHHFGYRDSVYRSMPQRVILSAVFQLKAGVRDDIRMKMDDLMRRRVEKQPLEYPSAGSTFKRYPGRYTAQMIDEAGLKGCSVGAAQVSEKHAGFVINRGGATSADVLALIEHIRAAILARFGVEIETEVVYVPEK